MEFKIPRTRVDIFSIDTRDFSKLGYKIEYEYIPIAGAPEITTALSLVLTQRELMPPTSITQETEGRVYLKIIFYFNETYDTISVIDIAVSKEWNNNKEPLDFGYECYRSALTAEEFVAIYKFIYSAIHKFQHIGKYKIPSSLSFFARDDAWLNRDAYDNREITNNIQEGK